MDEWTKIMKEMEIDFDKSPSDRLLYEIAHAYYGYIGYCIGINNSGKALEYIEKGERNLEFLLKKYPNWAEIHALRGAYYGFRLSLAPYKAIFLGPKSMDHINKAIQLNKYSASGYIEKANAAYHMPPVFGGSMEEALKNYSISLKLFEQAGHTYTWQYLNTYVNLATVYERMGDYNSAVKIYRKILDIEPEFKVVKNKLLPYALKKTK